MSLVPTESFFLSGSASAVRWLGGSSSSASSGRSNTAREPLQDRAIRNRENLVVSNGEIRQLFDTMKELGGCVRRQNTKLETMSVKLEDACKEMNELKTQLKTVYTSRSNKDQIYTYGYTNGCQSRSQNPRVFWSAPRHGALEQSFSRVQDFRTSGFTALKRRPEVKLMWIRPTKAFNTHSHRLYR